MRIFLHDNMPYLFDVVAQGRLIRCVIFTSAVLHVPGILVTSLLLAFSRISCCVCLFNLKIRAGWRSVGGWVFTE